MLELRSALVCRLLGSHEAVTASVHRQCSCLPLYGMEAVDVLLLQRGKGTTPGLFYLGQRAVVVEEHTKKIWEIFRVINETEDFGVANTSKTT